MCRHDDLSVEGRCEMSQQIRRAGTDGSRLNRFERNAYFHGKLMTARDMEAEQSYHRERTNAISNHVLGGGLVCGLGTTISETDRRGLEATIEPGLAVDRQGQLMVVPSNGPYRLKERDGGDTDPEEPCHADGKDIYVFLEYRECHVESVPIPDGADGCEERCCHNRIVETFDVVYSEQAPTDYKTVPSVTFPAKEKLTKHGGSAREHHEALTQMARSYYDEYSEDCDGEPFSVYLGHFEKDSGSEWERDPTPDLRSFLYTNDMLYAIIASHVTDFDDPHEIDALKSIHTVSNPNGNVDLNSPNDTLSIAPDQNAKQVNIDVKGDYVTRVEYERLERRVRELEKQVEHVLEECCDDDIVIEKQADPKQERSERQQSASGDKEE